MRLGEIKQKIDRVISDSKIIVINSEPQYEGRAQLVNNYSEIVETLDCVSNQSWSGIDGTLLSDFKESHHVAKSFVFSQDDFSKLENMVNMVNQKLPVFYNILETMVEFQDERAINIKLPVGIISLDQLTKFNKKIDNVLKFYNVDGQFDFKSFDRGTDWYIVVASGVLSYKFLIAGLDIAQKYFEMRKVYCESKTAEIDYRAAVEKDNVTKQEISEFTTRKLSLFVKEEINQAIEKIGVGTNNMNELSVKLINATTALIKELDEGTEFHLSLNPPVYADEANGQIIIDYNKIRPLIEDKTEDIKQLEELNNISDEENDK